MNKLYLVAVMAKDWRGKARNDIFQFNTKKDRDAFIKDIKKYKVKYATSETKVK
jgi:hypothetical protein